MKTRRPVIFFAVFCLVLVLVTGLAGACTKETAEPAAEPAKEPATTVPAAEPTTEPAAEPIQLRLAIQSFPTEPITLAIDDFAKSFNERAQGKAEIVVYGGGSLGLSEQYLNMIRTGAVDLGVIPIGRAAQDAPIFGVIDLPFLLNNVAARDAAMQPIADAVFNRVFEEQFNQMPVAWSPVAFQDIGSTKSPIKTMEDLNGMLVAASSMMQFKIMEALGASPVEVPGPEVFGALEKGVIDGVLMPVDAVMAMKLFEIMPYWTVCRVHSAYQATNISLDAYNKLPADIQTLLLEEGQKCTEAAVISMEAAEAELAGALQQAGMEFYELPTAEKENWRQTCLPLWDEFTAEVGPDVETVIAIAEDINKANP